MGEGTRCNQKRGGAHAVKLQGHCACCLTQSLTLTLNCSAQEDGATESKRVEIFPGWETQELGGPPSIIAFYPLKNYFVLGVDVASIQEMQVTRAVVWLEVVFLLLVLVCAVCQSAEGATLQGKKGEEWLARKSKHSLPWPFGDKQLFGDAIVIKRWDVWNLSLDLILWEWFKEDPDDLWVRMRDRVDRKKPKFGVQRTAKFALHFRPGVVSRTDYFDQFRKYEQVRNLSESACDDL